MFLSSRCSVSLCCSSWSSTDSSWKQPRWCTDLGILLNYGHGSELDPDSFGSLDPDPEGQKWPTKVGKILEISCFEVLDVLFWELKASSVTGALGMGKLHFLLKKKKNFSCKFFKVFVYQNPGSGSLFSLKCLIWIRIWIKWMWIRNPAFKYHHLKISKTKLVL